MKKIITTLSAAFLLLPVFTFAQHTFTSGSNTIEIGGYLVGFGQYEPTYVGSKKNDDRSNNTFVMDDARFGIKGWLHGRIKFHVEVNFAAIPSFISEGVAVGAKDNPITECHVEYVNPYVNVKLGYMKVPFGALSILDKLGTPYLGRPKISDGDFYPRRDIGIQLNHDFWHQRITVYAAMFTGQGEASILGANDVNGKFEYVGRIQLSTAYYRIEQELDKNNLALPVAHISGGVRYNEKTSFAGKDGTGVTVTSVNSEDVRTIDGTKLTYGLDAGFMWHGFSAQFEMARSRMSPHTNTPLYTLLREYNTTFYNNGGYLVQANYYCKRLMSAISLRYDEFNLSDLVAGGEHRSLGIAYNFIYAPYHLQVRIHYAYRFKQPNSGIKWDNDQLRCGIVWEY